MGDSNIHSHHRRRTKHHSHCAEKFRSFSGSLRRERERKFPTTVVAQQLGVAALQHARTPGMCVKPLAACACFRARNSLSHSKALESAPFRRACERVRHRRTRCVFVRVFHHAFGSMYTHARGRYHTVCPK